MDILGMKVYLSWYERDDEIFILLNSCLLLVTDTYHLSKVRNHHFAQRNVKSIDGGSCLGIFVGWMFSPLPSITADEPFIHLSVRWPPRQKARSKPTKPHTSDFVGGLILPKWPEWWWQMSWAIFLFSWRASWEYPLGLHPGWTMILFSQK